MNENSSYVSSVDQYECESVCRVALLPLCLLLWWATHKLRPGALVRFTKTSHSESDRRVAWGTKI